MNALKLMATALSCVTLALSLGAVAHEAGSEKVTVLEEHPMLNAPGKKAVMLTVDYTPGQASIAHTHQGSALAYVLEGEVVSRVNDAKAITYKQGQTFYEPAGSRHYESKNASATKPAKLLVFVFMDEKGEVLEPMGK
jgi:quercetin dioxygenase-like cupin family protein